MSYLLIFGIGVFSAFLFDLMPVVKNTGLIFQLQKASFSAIQDPTKSDEQKQRILLINSGKLLLTTLKLLLFFCVIILPFALLTVICKEFTTTNIETLLVSTSVIVLSLFAFISYFLLKKMYGKLKI